MAFSSLQQINKRRNREASGALERVGLKQEGNNPIESIKPQTLTPIRKWREEAPDPTACSPCSLSTPPASTTASSGSHLSPPPALIAANSLVHLRPAFLEPFLPSIHDVWFNPHLILKNKDLKRFLLSPFYHVGESHLVYNMLSLLWKGIKLESSMESAEFASMIAVLLGMSQGITFAMKVVLNNQSGNYSYVHGISMPSRYAAWVELVLIQMLVPGVSFIGHLGGILAGIFYLRLRGVNSGSDPLTVVVRGVTDVLKLPLRFLRHVFPFRRRQVSGRGPVGGGWRGIAVADWRCSACTYENSGWLDACEMCSTNRNDSGSDNTRASRPLPDYSRDLTLEELRLERFGRR